MKNHLGLPCLFAPLLFVGATLLAGVGCESDDAGVFDGDSAADVATDGSPTADSSFGNGDATNADASATDSDSVDVGPALPIEVSTDFECGAMGLVSQPAPGHLRMALRADNDDDSLPDSWRNWWYVRLDQVPVGEELDIRVSKRGFSSYYVPVYSYDNETWFHMEETEVETTESTIFMRRSFEQPTVWLARFYPYSHSRAVQWAEQAAESPFVELSSIGDSVEGRSLDLLTITDFAVPESEKSRIWIHGRTHPAEIGSSFVMEGLVEFLLGGSAEANAILSGLVIHIVPMHNPDGVVAGNYRTTTGSINLENSWFYDTADPFLLQPSAPQEVRVLRDAMADSLLGPNAIPVTIAINLHSSQSGPSDPAFFFPHFGPTSSGYSSEEAALWSSQIEFIESVESYYGVGLIEPPGEGGSSFASNHFPETWWWLNRGPEVMAVTMETVYGKAGFPDWVTPDDIRELGDAVGHAIYDYHF